MPDHARVIPVRRVAVGAPVAVEALERRAYLNAGSSPSPALGPRDVAASAVVSNGQLLVTGTAGDDSISVQDFSGQLLVRISGSPSQFFDFAGISGIVIDGGAGNDTLDINSTIPATLHGGAGDDSLNAQSNNDLLLGEAGNDSLQCGGTADTLSGGDGNDTLSSDANGNVLTGEAGDDSLSAVSDHNTLLGGAGNDTLSSVGNANLLAGGAGNDSIDTTDNGSTLRGGGGDDTLDSVGSNDLVVGGAGNDLIFDVSEADTVDGGAGNDLLQCVGINCSLLGGAGDDVFIDYGSGDSIDGGTGLNLAGSNNTDSLINIFEVFDPSPGGFGAAAAAQKTRLEMGSPAAAPAAPAFGTSPLDLAGGAVATVVGGVLKITGTPGNDSISVGFDGLASLTVSVGGGAPQDFPLLGLIGVMLVGGAGDDTLAVDPTVLLPATLRGGAGNDSLTGGGGDNVLVGGAGNDTVVGGARSNLLVPGARLAFASQSTGNDLLVGGPPGSSNIADFSRRTDNLFLSNDGRPDSGDAAQGDAITIMPSVQDMLSGTGDNTVVSTTSNSLLTGGVGHDSLVSGGDANVIIAGPNGGDTVVSTGAHNALLLRNMRADVYRGDTSTDILQVDMGTDTLGT